MEGEGWGRMVSAATSLGSARARLVGQYATLAPEPEAQWASLQVKLPEGSPR